MENVTTYSAIAAKIKAKQSRLLTDDDFRQLAFLDGVPAAAEFLKKRPAYEQEFRDAGTEDLHREKIEQLLWLSLYRDYSSLYRFASIKQRNFLDLYFMHFEIDATKRCLRNAASNRTSDLDLSVFEDFFRRHSRLNLTALSNCVSLGEFVEGLKGSYYYEPLKALFDRGVTSLFDYESALDTLYFIRLWKNLKDALSKKEYQAVVECIGEKIDLLNLEWMSRAKRHYQLSGDVVEGFLIPVYYRLRKKQVHEMAFADTEEDYIQILKTTRYGNRIFKSTDKFSSQGDLKLKPLFRSLLDAVYQSSMRKHPYSAAVLNSYFYFKEEEIRKLITAIEGIRYRLDGNEILLCLEES